MKIGAFILLAMLLGAAAKAAEIHDAAKAGNLAKVQLLLQTNPALVKAVSNDGKTPLHYAALGGNKTLCEALISRGADVNAKDRDDWTPLHCAALKGQTEIARLLLLRGANIHALDNTGSAPLFWAVERDTPDQARLLIGKGAGASAHRNDGKTIEHCAASGTYLSIATVLRSEERRVGEECRSRWAPYH